MYVWGNIEVRSCNLCFSRKLRIITYSVFVALGIQHAMHTRHIDVCGMSGSLIFFHSITYSTIIKKTIENKMYFGFLYDLAWNISHYKKNWARYDKKCIFVFI
jgi:hypothetical protein